MKTVFWKGGSKEPLQALSRPAETRCFLHTGREVGKVSWFFFSKKNCRLLRLSIIVPEMQTASCLVQQKVRGSGEFLDLDNQFETNPLTGHADAVGIVIARKENAGGLAYDPKWCWRLNGGDEGRRWSDQHLAQTQGFEATAAQLLQRAAIDRHCDRTDRLAADLDRARALLPPAKYMVLAGLVRHLTVGKLPTW